MSMTTARDLLSVDDDIRHEDAHVLGRALAHALAGILAGGA